jgi:hypothetical protein
MATPSKPESLKAGRALFIKNDSTLKIDDQEYGTNQSDSLHPLRNNEQSNSIKTLRKYNKKEFYESIRDMDYGKIFASQCNLTNLTDKFDFDSVDKHQRAGMI